MSQNRIKTVALFAFLFLVCVGFFTFSIQMQGQEHQAQPETQTKHAVSSTEEHQEDHTSGSSEFIGKTLNFLILFGGLALILRKPISRFLKNHSEGIKIDLDDAENSQQVSRKNLKKIHSRLKKVAKEAELIKQEAGKLGIKDKERILQEARIETERHKESVKQDIELLSQFGMQELKAYAVEIATTLARERIMKKITPEDQIILINRSIERLETLYEKPGSS